MIFEYIVKLSTEIKVSVNNLSNAVDNVSTETIKLLLLGSNYDCSVLKSSLQAGHVSDVVSTGSLQWKLVRQIARSIVSDWNIVHTTISDDCILPT